ncbi:Kinesin motor domain containing protein, partial [Reticulomyxa filosa]
VELSAVETFGKHVSKIELFDLCDKQNLKTEAWKNKQGSTMLDMKRSIQRLPLQNYKQALEIVHQIHLSSHFAPTGKNPKSSRGHVAFILHVTTQEEEEEEAEDGTRKVATRNNIKGKLERQAHYIVLDLAGSEGESALTDDFTKEMNESEVTDRRLEAWCYVLFVFYICINHGLSEVQEIFKEMRTRKLRKTVGSGLRRTLYQYLNVNMFISVLFTLSPSMDNSKPTMSTLRFAETASLVKVTPMRAKTKLNKDLLIQQLQEYLDKLQGVISSQKTAILQLQEEVLDIVFILNQSMENKGKLETLVGGDHMTGVKKIHAEEMGIEEEKVNEQLKDKARVSIHREANGLLTLSVETTACFSEDVPASFDEF